jgi:hypothetical protein
MGKGMTCRCYHVRNVCAVVGGYWLPMVTDGRWAGVMWRKYVIMWVGE